MESINEFSGNYLQSAFTSTNDNVVTSPLSLVSLLYLLWAGAHGQTKSSIASTLKINPSISDQVHHTEYDKIFNKLNSDPLLKSATKIFLNQEFNVTQPFEQFVQPFNFKDIQKVTNSVNSWIERYTNGKIKKLIDDNMIKSDTIMVLLNALYFKGLWKNPFTDTRQDDFNNIDGTQTRVTFMNEILTSTDLELRYSRSILHKTTTGFSLIVQVYKNQMTQFRYHHTHLRDLDAEVLELPYLGSDIVMLICLPNKQKGLIDLLRNLPTTQKKILTARLDEKYLSANIPRFKIESSLNLNGILKELGMFQAFADNADFSGMLKSGTGPAKVSSVVQKTVIEVDEKGTESGTGTGALIIPRMSLEDFNCKHPFLFYIYHKTLKIPIIAGVVRNLRE